jgi:glycine/D-amino acid oxidase-like deaminating enzyme
VTAPTRRRVAVVGAGIQGCCIALELALRGVEVEVFERQEAPMLGASRQCEGKLHLGFVFAADRTLGTARLMARGAGTFLPALRRWIDGGADTLAVSEPFHYAVHRDSLYSPEDLAARYGRIRTLIEETIPFDAHPGEQDPTLVERIDASDAFGPDVSAVFRTSEIAVHPDHLADAIIDAVDASARITLRTGMRVVAVDRDAGRLQVAEGNDEPSWTPAYDHVVNCAWDGRLALDATAGMLPTEPWCFRMKYFARVRLPAGEPPPPNTTIVLGPFGDVVDLGEGDLYVSWYPAGRRGWSGDVQPPPWPTEPGPVERTEILAGMVAGLEGTLPRVADILRRNDETASVRGGVIYALGETDVDDRNSVLHERRRVGPRTHGRYHTVDTGKRTLAPLFALELADRIHA